MISPANCATGTLAPFEPSDATPWSEARVLHLYRRLGFGATPDEVATGLAESPAALVSRLLDSARHMPPSSPPEWAFWTLPEYEDFGVQQREQFIEWTLRWVQDMAAGGIREKLALFWHNHFVTRFQVYLCPSHLYQYHVLLQAHALGNFRTFVYEMGRTPAMLVFLNGVQNTRQDPNENYARELYELFTLGRDNGYTQADVTETARALTGWVGLETFCGAVNFVEIAHDSGPKTVFGRTGNWGYDEVHTLLFEERGELIARYICGKLYRHFVHPEADEAIVAGLAATLLAHDFELAPVFLQLFQSEHFFAEAVISAIVQSPLDRMLSFIREGGFPQNEQLLEAVTFQAYQQGHTLFDPVDVAGWPGNRSWITNNTLSSRWQTLRYYLYYVFENHPAYLIDLARRLAGAEADDPAKVTRAIVDYFLPRGLQRIEDYRRATDVFKYEIPQNYFDEGLWNLYWEDTVPAQTALLLDHIIRLPEFQLG